MLDSKLCLITATCCVLMSAWKEVARWFIDPTAFLVIFEFRAATGFFSFLFAILMPKDMRRINGDTAGKCGRGGTGIRSHVATAKDVRQPA